MDESVTPGIDDRFPGLGEREVVRCNRRRWGGSTGRCRRRVAARSGRTWRTNRGGAPSAIAASVARVAWAAVRGAPSRVRVSVVWYENLSGVGCSGSVKVGIEGAGGTVMKAPPARAEAGR